MPISRQNQEEFLVKLGQRIAEIRRDRQMTQQAVADAVGCSVQTVQRAETGKTALSLAGLFTVTKILEVEVADVLGDLGNAIPQPERDLAESELLRIWQQVPERSRQQALKVLRSFLG